MILNSVDWMEELLTRMGTMGECHLDADLYSKLCH